jgi:hypothetical protein
MREAEATNRYIHWHNFGLATWRVHHQRVEHASFWSALDLDMDLKLGRT